MWVMLLFSFLIFLVMLASTLEFLVRVCFLSRHDWVLEKDESRRRFMIARLQLKCARCGKVESW
jgi:hypothetical protein